MRSPHRLVLVWFFLTMIAFGSIATAQVCRPSDAPGGGHGDDSGLVVSYFALPTANPGDLAWDGEALWVTDWEAGDLIRLNPETGEVMKRVAAPCYRPRGLTWADGKLYICDDFDGRIFVFDPATGITVTDYRTPNGTGLGLAWDGEAVWLAEDGEHDLYRLIPGDGTALTYFDAPRSLPTGLAYDGTYLWVAQRRHDRIYLVDPSTGQALTGFNSPGPYPCGLAPAPDGRLWVADFEEALVYLCAPREARYYQTRDWREAEVKVVYRLENHGPGDILDAVVNFAFPEESENMKLLSAPEFGVVQPERWNDEWGQPIATFRRATLGPGERFEVGYEAKAAIGEVNFLVFPDRVGSLEDIPSEIRTAYTADGERLQVELELIKETSAKIVGDEENPYWIARKIFDWVIGALEYERVGGWDVPETLIKRGTGSCSEYAFLYIGLCRAAGLPARYEAGAAVRGDDTCTDDVHHRWAEVYLPNYGWIPVDPSGGDQSTPGGQVDAIGRLSNRFFVTTRNGGGSKALGWTYNAHATHSKKGRCAVTEDMWFYWHRAKREGTAIIPLGERAQP